MEWQIENRCLFQLSSVPSCTSETGKLRPTVLGLPCSYVSRCGMDSTNHISVQGLNVETEKGYEVCILLVQIRNGIM
jgi:hypothetical protein